MKYGFYAKKMNDDLFGIVTMGLQPKHPEITMITNENHIGEDMEFLMSLTNEVMKQNKKFCDHYLLMDTNKDYPSLKAFIIYEPGNNDRFRLVIVRRSFYDISIKKQIPF